MFSTAQLDLIAPMVQSMYVDGYEYYVVHTNTNLSSYSNYDFCDLTFYFSKEPIECDDYTFSSEADSVLINAVTRNVSSNSSDNRVERIQSQKLSSFEISVDSYEHIMTNSEGVYFADVMAMTEYTNNNDITYNMTLNDWFVVPVLIGVIVVTQWFRVWFARNGGGKSESSS